LNQLAASTWRQRATQALAVLATPAWVLVSMTAGPASAQGSGNEALLAAREAWTQAARDSRQQQRLSQIAGTLAEQNHPLAAWADYWRLNARLADAQQSELDAFYARWAGSYVEDRLRNDWLLELGKRRDWVNFRVEFPRFRMNDDREVTCYTFLARHAAGDKDLRAAALEAWLAQRDVDTGCQLLGSTLYEAGVFTPAEVAQELRLAAEFNRPRAARAAAALLGAPAVAAVDAAFADPAGWLRRLTVGNARGVPALRGQRADLAVLALWRLAAASPDDAAGWLDGALAKALQPDAAAHAWAGVAKQAALKLQDNALDMALRAWRERDAAGPAVAGWSDDLLAWHARAALRSLGATAQPSVAALTQPAARIPEATARQQAAWALVERASAALSPAAMRDRETVATWTYWRARSALAQSRPGAAGESVRAAARQALATLAQQPLSYHGQLALEDLGQRLVLPPEPPPLAATETQAARQNPGLVRALALIGLGLRSEGVREWNFTLRGMADRELLAAAAWACEREVWDRCINTSERTREQVSIAQRYPTPLESVVLAKSREVGVDPAYVYGLIRQESRFIVDARSHVGASGLMQLMPATARWTARRLGLVDFRPGQVNDTDTNVLLGASYLKYVLDDFNGAQALAAAAYNAGPNRPRRWREGPLLEAAIWTENVPFAETRDYVKKVLANAAVYSAVLAAHAAGTAGPGLTTAAVPPGRSLRHRLGATVGPRELSSGAEDRSLPSTQPD